MEALTFLKDKIERTMELPELIALFEEMCSTYPEADDMLLFETGTFSFSGQSMFYFSLVRQYPGEEEEYVQLHLDVRFQPDDKYRLLSGAVWSDGSNEDFFKFVRESGAYRAVKGDRIATVSVYLDET